MPLINCEINLMLTWLAKCVISDLTESDRFVITKTKLYDLVVNLSNQGNKKLVQ